MECELCGKEARLVKAKVEGTVVSVCEDCSGMGHRVHESKPVPMREKPKLSIDQTIINPDFANIVKNARESKNLKREDLAKQINEKVSVIERIERSSRPTDSTAKKLEKALGIHLLGYEEAEYKEMKTGSEDITLGDVVKIKQRKK